MIMTQNMHFIFSGRFQPFHNDHLFILTKILQDYPDYPIYIGILFNVIDTTIQDNEFEKLSAEHFLPERNPFTPQQRLAMVTSVAHEYGNGRLFSTLMPKPSIGSSWKLICEMFPCGRTWIVPSCGEAWDDRKAEFFQQMGDGVKRIKFHPTTDGKQIRQALASGDYLSVQQSIPSPVWSVMENFL